MSMFGMFGPPPTPEEVEAHRKHQEQARMSLDEFRHSHQRLFEELDENQLTSLKTMLHWIQDSSGDGGRMLAAHWEGIAAHSLKVRFGICITCAVNHDKELVPPPPESEVKVGTEEGTLLFTPTQDDDPDQPELPLWGEEKTTVSDVDPDLMEKYHLDDLRDEDTHKLLGFVCTGINGAPGPCGSRYPSIEDRMLREPETCSGCFVRMANG